MKSDHLTVIIEKGKKRLIAKTPLKKIDKLVFVVNRQFTNAPNTTQLASGAGRSSASGSNAAIKSPFTQQQQSVGAGGKAINKWGKGKDGKGHPHKMDSHSKKKRRHRKEVTIVLNDQIVKLPRSAGNAGATQVASGAGKYSTSGTNSAIESRGTKQQHAVGGGGKAINKWGGKKRKKKFKW